MTRYQKSKKLFHKNTYFYHFSPIAQEPTIFYFYSFIFSFRQLRFNVVRRETIKSVSLPASSWSTSSLAEGIRTSTSSTGKSYRFWIPMVMIILRLQETSSKAEKCQEIMRSLNTPIFRHCLALLRQILEQKQTTTWWWSLRWNCSSKQFQHEQLGLWRSGKQSLLWQIPRSSGEQRKRDSSAWELLQKAK